jgi:hypothetical protein
MVEKLIDKMFASRNAAHIEHWKTKSYAQHMALGDFYESVISSIDDYVEAHQGTFGLVGSVKGEEADVTKLINDNLIWLNENRSEITKGVPALENLVDSLTDIHMKTLYKLENLR